MYWNVYRDMAELRKNLDQVFNGLDTNWKPFSRVSFLPGLSARRYPLINMYQDTDNLYVEALAPGLDTDNLEVSVLDNTLTISGEKIGTDEDLKPESIHRSERATGKFIRKIELSHPTDEDNVKAEYINGILKMTLPKAEKAKPRRIAITAG